MTRRKPVQSPPQLAASARENLSFLRRHLVPILANRSDHNISKEAQSFLWASLELLQNDIDQLEKRLGGKAELRKKTKKTVA